MSKSVAQQFVCSNILSEFRVGIFAKGVFLNFDPANLYDITIEYNYSLDYASGVLRFKDVGRIMYSLGQNVIALPLVIEGKDCLNIKQTSVFMVTYFNRTSTDTGEEIVIIEFIDEWAYIMNNTFISKGFENTNGASILGAITSQFRKDKLFLENKELHVDTSLEKLESLVVPGNMSLFKWCTLREHIEGFELVNSRNAISFVKATNIWKNASAIKKVVLKKSLLEISPFTYVNMTYSLNNIHTNSIPSTNCIQFKDDKGKHILTNFDDKNNKKLTISSKSIFDEIKPETKFTGMGDTLMYGSDYYGRFIDMSKTMLEKTYSNKVLLSNMVEVNLSVGTYAYGLGQKVTLESPKVAGESDGKPAPHIDGDYIIVGVIDLYKGANFYQTLHLARAGLK